VHTGGVAIVSLDDVEPVDDGPLPLAS
jgi:hypothetical protein